MIDTSIISKGLSFLLEPASNYIGRQIVGEEILKRRQFWKAAFKKEINLVTIAKNI